MKSHKDYCVSGYLLVESTMLECILKIALIEQAELRIISLVKDRSLMILTARNLMLKLIKNTSNKVMHGFKIGQLTGYCVRKLVKMMQVFGCILLRCNLKRILIEMISKQYSDPYFLTFYFYIICCPFTVPSIVTHIIK